MPTDSVTRDFVRYRATGRPALLARVFDAVAQELLLVATHLVAPGSAAPEDLVQATFLKAIEAADDFDEHRRVQPWLIGILTNEARAARRRARRQPDPDRLDVRPSLDPSATAEEAEFAAAVRDAILELPEPYRDALTLRLVHGLTPTQIAHALGQPPGTVKSWIHRGIDRLRTLLPAGFAASLAVFVQASEGLVGVRVVVLRTAAERGPVAALSGGWLAAVALVVLSIGGFFWWWSEGSPELPDAGRAVSVAPPVVHDRGGDPDRVPSDPVVARAPGLHLWTLRAEGDPLPAAVYLRPRFGADPELRGRWIETGADGYVHLTEIAVGAWDAILDRGFLSRVDVVPGSATELRLRAPAVPVLRGVVRVRGGEPLADAELWLTMAGSLSEGHVVGRTDGRGRFSLEGVPGARALSAQKAGFMTGGLHAVPPPVERTDDSDWEVEVRSRGALVRGTVVDGDGQPMDGARVMLGSPAYPEWDLDACDGMRLRPPVTVWTTGDGGFAIRTAAPNRATSLWVRAPGFAPTRLPLQVPEIGAEIVVTATLERGVRCMGVAEDVSGSAVAGARLRVDHRGSINRPVLDQAPSWVASVARADSDGTFALEGLPDGWVRLAARAPARDLWAARVDQVDGAPLRWRPILGRGASLAGRVRSGDGTKLEGWRVVASAVAAPAAMATTDANGAFALSGLEDRPYTVTVLPPVVAVRGDDSEVEIPADRPTPALVREDARPGEPLDLRVGPEGLQGSVVRATVTGATDRVTVATLTAVDGGSWHGPLGESGQVEIGPVPAGTYYLSLEHADGMDLLHGPFAVGQQSSGGNQASGGSPGPDVDLGLLVCEPAGRIRVQLRTQGAVPADMVQVSIYSTEGAMAPTVLALTEGRGTSWSVPPGRYLVTLEDPRLATVQAPVVVGPGEIAQVVLEEPANEPVDLRWPGHPAFAGMCRVRFDLQEQGTGVRYHLPIGARCVPGRPLGLRLRLPPGRYQVVGTSALGSARAIFEVAQHRATGPVDLR